MISANQVDSQPAYLLHRREYRESSLLVELFTPEFGRMSVVAKGARSAKSDKKGLLQPFQPLLVWWRGRGDLKNLTNVESSGHLPLLKAKVLASGFYVNELVMKLTQRHDAHLLLFNQYHDCLNALAHLDRDTQIHNALLQASLRYFEMNLIQSIGYGISLDCQADNGQPIHENGHYLFYPDYGAVACKSNAIVAEGALMINGRSLLAIHNQCLIDDVEDAHQTLVLKQVKQLNRLLLNRLLGGQTLHSRSLLS